MNISQQIGVAISGGLDMTDNQTQTQAKTATQVKDLMTAHAEWVDADTPIREVATKMRDRGIGCLPVGDNDKLIGMITDRDIACRAVADGLDLSKVKARDVMSKGITWCFEDQSDVEATKLMESKNIHHLPVLNREKRIVGMLSFGDLALRSESLTEELLHMAARDASRYAKAQPAHEAAPS
jgi:CBS domain-containing protein